MAKNKETKSSNLGLKLISLVLALLLEVYFYSPDNSVTAVIPVTVKIFGLPQDVMIVKPIGAAQGVRAEMEVRGPGPLVAQLQSSPNLLHLQAPENAPREFTMVIEESKLQLPSGVEVLSVTPVLVHVATEKVIRKKLIVVGQRVGTPEAGYVVEEISFAPDTVLASGPESRVKGLSAIETSEIDVSGLIEPTRLDVPLRSYGPLVRLEVKTVRVDIKVAPVQGEAALKNVPVEVLAPDGYTALAKSVQGSLKLQGPVAELEKLKKSPPRLSADARALGVGEHSVELTVRLPKSVEVLELTPAAVTVSVKGGSEVMEDRDG